MRLMRQGVAVVLVFAALSAVGCHAECQRRYSKLELKCEELSFQTLALQDQLSTADRSVGTLQDQLKQAKLQMRTEVKSTPKPAPLASEKVLYQQTLGSDVLFASAQAKLTSNGKKALDKIAAILKRDYPGRIIRIYGHTDSDPITKSKKFWQDNLDLSANRAMAVTRYLIAKGIKASKIETVAMGATRPLADNRTKEGKARNRRVEINVIDGPG